MWILQVLVTSIEYIKAITTLVCASILGHVIENILIIFPDL